MQGDTEGGFGFFLTMGGLQGGGGGEGSRRVSAENLEGAKYFFGAEMPAKLMGKGKIKRSKKYPKPFSCAKTETKN